MGIYFRLVPLLVLTSVAPIPCWSGASYETIMALFEEKLGSANYNPEIRPENDHTIKTNVSMEYVLNSIEEVDDVRQTITTSGYFSFEWTDQRLTWDPDNYSNLTHMHPQPKQVWRPRMVITNSREERDHFQDKVDTFMVTASGWARWAPSLVLPTSCPLKMDKYPFDSQECFIELCPMNLFNNSLILRRKYEDAQLPWYVPNKGWDLISTHVEMIDVPIARNLSVSCALIYITIQRRSSYYVINIILPAVLLTFLNIFIFAIPVESGEKISYGTTVLTALTVFLSLISSMMPQSSEAVPAVTIYLFSLLVGSVASVLVTIGIVALYHKDMKEQTYLKANVQLKHAFRKLTNVKKTIQPLNGSMTENQVSTLTSSGVNNEDDSPIENRTNRYRVVSKYIDVICFIVFFLLWVAATLRFFVYANS